MLCCGVCALKQRFRNSGQGSLPRAPALSWLSLHWGKKAFHGVLLDDSTLSERVFGKALRTLVDREMALVEEVLKKQPPKRG
jgi:hypothetical protein